MSSKTKTKETLSLIGAAILGAGFAAGWFARQYAVEKRPIHADDILEKVKKTFLKEGPIEGSWIELTKVPLRKFAYKTDVYYGGISRLEEGELVQYEFIADAYSGSIMDVYRV
ncbi:PepSY domain-containing protein [Atopococcus tabaci]|uniref:PepSY domain-containing protein n=1 Tax=Atopococcus tabaci TaxID=269774 RepID=UPI0004133BFA|nr:PepSY domain-containing protein [Atopococcus tabaci]